MTLSSFLNRLRFQWGRRESEAGCDLYTEGHLKLRLKLRQQSIITSIFDLRPGNVFLMKLFASMLAVLHLLIR